MSDKDEVVLTPEEFKALLRKQGVTLKQWCEERGYDPNYASKVLNGMVKGNRGLAHKIASDMQLK